MEDCVREHAGALAGSNADLVRGWITVAKNAGRDIATAYQTRQLLGLPS